MHNTWSSRASVTAGRPERGEGRGSWRRHLLAVLAMTMGWVPTPQPAAAQPGLGLGDVQILKKSVAVRAWTVQQDLPQSSVTEMLRDRNGYLWGATFGGLFRFDGRLIRRYTLADLPVMSGNAVSALAIEPDDGLLIGTLGGSIVRLRDGKFVDTLPVLPPKGNAVSIDALLADRPDEVLVRRALSVQRFFRGRWTEYPWRSATGFVRDSKGRALFVGPDGVIQINADGSSVRVSPVPVLEEGREVGLYLDEQDRLWIPTADGVWTFESGKGARRVVAAGKLVTVVSQSPDGVVWYAANDTLYRWRLGQPNVLTNPEPLVDASARIASMVSTADGMMAIGTLEGLLLVRDNFISVLESRHAIPSSEAGSIVGAGDGTVWITSSCGKALRSDRTGRVVDSLARPNPLGCTRSLAIDSRGAVWAGGDGALRRRGPDAAETVWAIDTQPPGLALVRPLLAHGDSLFFGVSDGRVGVVGTGRRPVFLPGWGTKGGPAVESLARDAEGSLWIAQNGRLSRFRNGGTVAFDTAAGIPRAAPRALHADSVGGLWIGTYGAGLWYFRPGSRARSVPTLDQTVSAIFAGTSGRVWMPGNRGLSVVTQQSLRAWVLDSALVPEVRLLSFAEGVPEGNLGYPAATRIAEGVLAFASVTGLVVVHTPGVMTTGETPAVRIDEVRSSSGAFVERHGSYVVRPTERAVYAAFSMPTFRFADAAQFRYRLNGREWVTLGEARQLQFSISDPGEHVLELEGKVPGGRWVRAAPVTLDVTPLFAERVWPRVVLVVLVIGLFVGFSRQRVQAMEATARAREITLHARREAAELAEQHHRELAQVGRVAVAGELTASLSHELGQPLAAIVNNAEVARRLMARQHGQAGANPAVEQALLDVVAQGRRASQVVREFRRFLKREHGEREQLGARELIDSTSLLLRQEFQESRVTFHVQVYPATPPLMVERVLLQQVLVNLLQNALEAARRSAGGQVLVRARPVDDGVRITVADTGPGFSPGMRRTAFEPFVTTRANGMGMGLAIARRVVEAHGGHIATGRLPGAGAVVSLWLPANHVPADRTDSLIPLQVTSDG
jgi:signal transduction histidine kinase/ligand-binding sensor domain-containing protein